MSDAPVPEDAALAPAWRQEPGIEDVQNPTLPGCPAVVKYGRKRGRQCGAEPYVILGEDSDADGIHCFSHQTAEFKRKRGFGGPIEGSGRKKSPANRAREAVQDELERRAVERAEKIVGTYFDALDASTTITVKLSPGREAEVEIVEEPDHKIRMDASDRILDRVLGRPVQSIHQRTLALNVEASGEDEMVALLEQMAAAREAAPAE